MTPTEEIMTPTTYMPQPITTAATLSCLLRA